MTHKSNTTAGRALRKCLEKVRYHQGAALGDAIEARIRAKAQARREQEKEGRDEDVERTTCSTG